MNWDDLKVFLAVYRSGSFAAAGRALGVNATTVGRRIGAFERDVSSRLFTRTQDGLVPTATAEELLESAEQMERVAGTVARQITGEDARLEGKVRIATSNGFASGFLLEHLGALRTLHPRIELEVLTSVALHDISRGAADIAVRFAASGSGVPSGQRGPTDVLAQRMCPLGVGVYASKNYLDRKGSPADLEEFEGQDLVMPQQSLSYVPGFPWYQRVAERNRITLTVDSFATIAAAASAGFGLCAMPCFLSGRYPELVRVGEPQVVDEREMWLMMPADLKRVTRVRTVRDFLVGVLRAWEPVLAGRITPTEARRRGLSGRGAATPESKPRP